MNVDFYMPIIFNDLRMFHVKHWLPESTTALSDALGLHLQTGKPRIEPCSPLPALTNYSSPSDSAPTRHRSEFSLLTWICFSDGIRRSTLLVQLPLRNV